MTQKHFVALAEALQTSEPDHASQACRAQWAQDCMMVARVCAAFNPRFDRDRFLKACGATV